VTRRARIAWIVGLALAAVVAGVVWFRVMLVTVNVYVPPDEAPASASEEPPPAPAPAPDVPLNGAPGNGTPDGRPPMANGAPKGRPPLANGATTHAPSAPAAAPVADVDALLARMAIGSIAFNVPESLNVKETAVIQLLLSATAALEDLQRELSAPGAAVGARVRISERMEAHLSGPEFDITAITPETQAVSRQIDTEWKWEIKPKRAGRHALHLTLSALVSVEGETTPRTIKTFDRDIIIEITAVQRAAAFFAKNWQWLWAAILVPVVTWWWKRRRGATAAG
jgi:hypothetical protein